MELIAYSLSHRTASPDLLERLLDRSSRDQLISWTAASEDLLESVVVGTCLRVEIYGVVPDPERFETKLRDHLSLLCRVDPTAVPLRRFTGAGAAHHLFRVTSGLESSLWGETSVTHQVRQAYRSATDRGTAGTLLHRLFHMAFRVSKRLRAEAGVRSPWGSLPALAVNRALQNGAASLLIVGAGWAGRAAAREARRRNVSRLLIHGSRREDVIRLAGDLGAEAVPPSKLKDAVRTADAVVTASGRGLILNASSFSSRTKPVVVVDIGAPRNVDPAAASVAGVTLEDLQSIAAFAEPEPGPTARHRPWETILEEGVAQYEIWRRSRLGIEAPRATAPTADGGTVQIVGAGPGDPSLLTLKALRLLESADIVFYDALISAAILDLIPSGIRRVPVGRRKGHTVCPQDQVHRGMIAWAQRGARVVRLKGGDPMVFGRAAEEVDALRRAGVGAEIVPGVTAASAAASALTTSLTLRGRAASCAFVTGHGAPGSEDPAARIERIARHVETLAVYMAATRSAEIGRALLRAGRDPDEGVAVVERASLPGQRIRYMPLAELAWCSPEAFGQPALILAGPTIPREPGTGALPGHTVEEIPGAAVPPESHGPSGRRSGT